MIGKGSAIPEFIDRIAEVSEQPAAATTPPSSSASSRTTPR